MSVECNLPTECPRCHKDMTYAGFNGVGGVDHRHDSDTGNIVITCPWCVTVFQLTEESYYEGSSSNWKNWPPEDNILKGTALGEDIFEIITAPGPDFNLTAPDIKWPLIAGPGCPVAPLGLLPTPDEFRDCPCPSHKDQHGKVTYNRGYKATKGAPRNNPPLQGKASSFHYDARGLQVDKSACTDDNPCWGCAAPPKYSYIDFKAGKYDAALVLFDSDSHEFDDAFKHESYSKGFAVNADAEGDSYDWFCESIRQTNIDMRKAVEHTLRHGADNTECDNKCPDWKAPVEYDIGPDCICNCDCPCRDCTHDNCEY